MALTRYLYLLDEVSLTFMENLIKQEDLKECYFWLSEYYYSGSRRNTWQLLWQIFYDFYAIKYPKLEDIIKKEHEKWNIQKNIFYLMNVTHQLFERKTLPNVFLARHTPHRPKNRRGCPPKWLKLFTPENKPILLSIHSKDIGSILFHMKDMNSSDLYKLIRNYFKKVRKMNLQEGYLHKIPYNNKKHILLALILYLYLPESDINLEDFAHQASPEDRIWINQLNTKAVKPLYKTLPKKRLYAISNTIGCFQLKRFNPKCPPLKRMLGFHWTYFAYNVPLWKKRFRKYNAKRNISKLEMVFQNDDDLETFGEKYNYEPDEQSNETQNKSIRDIKKRTPNSWIADVFKIDYSREKLFPIYY
jgi:hypothetical protein